jgi:hypothetical protein
MFWVPPPILRQIRPAISEEIANQVRTDRRTAFRGVHAAGLEISGLVGPFICLPSKSRFSRFWIIFQETFFLSSLSSSTAKSKLYADLYTDLNSDLYTNSYRYERICTFVGKLQWPSTYNRQGKPPLNGFALRCRNGLEV